MADEKLLITIAQQLYERLSTDLQNLSLNIQTLHQAIPELSHRLHDIKSKVQNCEDISLANTTKLEAIEASYASTTSAAPRRSTRITQKMVKAAKAIYMTEYMENPALHASYLKKLQAADIDADEIPDHLKRHAEKTFEGMTEEERDIYVTKAKEMIA